MSPDQLDNWKDKLGVLALGVHVIHTMFDALETSSTADFSGLLSLLVEFGFEDLLARLSLFRQSRKSSNCRDRNTRAEICLLKEQLRLGEQQIAALELQVRQQTRFHRKALDALMRMKADLAHIGAEGAVLRNSLLSAQQPASAPPRRDIQISDVDITAAIATGSFGAVSKGRLRELQVDVTFKSFCLDRISNLRSDFETFRPVCTQLRHQALVPILAWSADNVRFHILNRLRALQPNCACSPSCLLACFQSQPEKQFHLSSIHVT
jgi:hypothetical protein